jgi:hypothetical protein
MEMHQNIIENLAGPDYGFLSLRIARDRRSLLLRDTAEQMTPSAHLKTDINLFSETLFF